MNRLVSTLAIACAMTFGTAANAVIVVQQNLTFSSVAPGANTQSLNLYNVAGSTLTSVLIQWTPTVTASGSVTLTSGSANTRTVYADLSLQSLLSSSAFNLNTTLLGSTSNVSFNTANRNRSATTSLSATNSLSPVDTSAFVGSGSVLVTNTFQNLLLITLHTISGGGGSVSLNTPILSGGGVLSITYNGTEVPTSAVPEPGTWLMMIVGFGLVGVSIRRNNRAVRTA